MKKETKFVLQMLSKNKINLMKFINQLIPRHIFHPTQQALIYPKRQGVVNICNIPAQHTL